VIVLDASAAVELLLGTPRGAAVAAALTGRPVDVHVPAHFPLEVLSVLRRLAATGVVASHRADGAVDDLAALPLVTHDPTALIARTWSLRQNATPYDACYLALAEGLDAPLLTGDRRLARSSGHAADVVVV